MAHPKLHLFPGFTAGTLAFRISVALVFPLISVLGIAQSPGAVLSAPNDAKGLGLGKFLVASRDLQDPVFAQSVILIVQYDQTGTIGLNINRRTEIPISRALTELGAAAIKHSDPVYVGGPVEVSVVRALILRAPRNQPDPQQARHVLNNIYMIWQRAPLEKELKTNQSPANFRVYLGYCGWARGQLENEIRAGAWHILDAGSGSRTKANQGPDVFDPNPGTVWKRAIAQTELQLARR